MMTQKHIGYTSWNDNFPADTQPAVGRFEGDVKPGLFEFTEKNGTVTMEAEHFFAAKDAAEAKWTVIPYMGRTLSGISLQPYSKSTEGAEISYKFTLTSDVRSVNIHFVLNATLAFARREGHRFTASIDGGPAKEINFNGRLNEEPENIYSVYYPTVATRVVDAVESFDISSAGEHTLTIKPIEPGTVFEKIVIDCGGFEPSYLFGNESPVARPSEVQEIPSNRPQMPRFTQEQLEQFRRMREEQEAAGQGGQGQQRQRRRN